MAAWTLACTQATKAGPGAARCKERGGSRCVAELPRAGSRHASRPLPRCKQQRRHVRPGPRNSSRAAARHAGLMACHAHDLALSSPSPPPAPDRASHRPDLHWQLPSPLPPPSALPPQASVCARTCMGAPCSDETSCFSSEFSLMTALRHFAARASCESSSTFSFLRVCTHTSTRQCRLPRALAATMPCI